MGFLRICFWALLGLCLILIGLANMQLVKLGLLPSALSDVTQIRFGLTVPLALVIYGSVIAGLLLGFVWEWFREYPQRAALDKSQREAARLRMELARLRAEKSGSEDRILTLLNENT